MLERLNLRKRHLAGTVTFAWVEVKLLVVTGGLRFGCQYSRQNLESSAPEILGLGGLFEGS